MRLQTKMDAGVLSLKVNGCSDFDLYREYSSASDRIGLGLRSVAVYLRAIDDRGSLLLSLLLVWRDKVAGNKEALCIENATADFNESC